MVMEAEQEIAGHRRRDLILNWGLNVGLKNEVWKFTLYSRNVKILLSFIVMRVIFYAISLCPGHDIWILSGWTDSCMIEKKKMEFETK